MPWNLFQETSQGTKNAIHLFCWKFSKKEKTLFLWLPHFLKVTTYLTQLAWWKWGVIILLSPHQTCQTISRNRGSIKVFEWRLGPYSVRKHCGTLQIEMPLLALTWFLMCRPYEIEMYDVEQKYLCPAERCPAIPTSFEVSYSDSQTKVCNVSFSVR